MLLRDRLLNQREKRVQEPEMASKPDSSLRSERKWLAALAK